MKKGAIIGIVVGVVLVLVILFFVLTNNKGEPRPVSNSNLGDYTPEAMIDCGMMDNPQCFTNRMSDCLPVTGKLTATDGSTEIELTILGLDFSNGTTCHFQRKVGGVVNLNCYFPVKEMSWNLIDQTFGNDKGLQSVVDSACKSG